MDMVKIGKFLADLRKENNLTQEQLGEEIGVTNKTISRWETGVYLPPVEMLQVLSEKYGVSINEILSGERLDEIKYKEKAEENIKTALEKSSFTIKDKEQFLDKKWLKDHKIEMIFEILVLTAIAVLGAVFYHPLCIVASVLCIVWSWFIYSRKRSYVERHLYNESVTEKEKDK